MRVTAKRSCRWLTLLCAASARSWPHKGSRRSPAPRWAAPGRRGLAEDVYRAACATCHGPDGHGSPKSIVGFDVPLPDFTDCAFATAEPDQDWQAVVHEGGRIRGLDRHMPAFGDALSPEEIALAVGHVRTFCRQPAWPRGDLNFPRAFFTEKAFPENEIGLGDDVHASRRARGRQRADLRAALRRAKPDRSECADRLPAGRRRVSWNRGLGDVAFAFRRTLYASMRTRRHRRRRRGSDAPDRQGGTRARQRLHRLRTVRDVGPDRCRATRSSRCTAASRFRRTRPRARREGVSAHRARHHRSRRTAASAAPGRRRSKCCGHVRRTAPSEWDVVPQMQVTLRSSSTSWSPSACGFRSTQREERPAAGPDLPVWDWFDGGFFEFWK